MERLLSDIVGGTRDKPNVPALDLEWLLGAIADIHGRLQHQATRAVNISLTLRNWLMGAYVHESSCAARIEPSMASACCRFSRSACGPFASRG
jgi:hypothetical protein